ncbi:hypothetical protein LDO26_17090 [Luteimonas sp. BDR2-5]|uniref:hypothetical protein n=1 Tax=Proluteimonas luteida TaxID=2878685 RepID=UPI001E3B7C37|nr:hypothetical protein [Luteimonas sp. BDR2-5]MCD9029909.1 hypothetical protein [Luteimonas sp. BDR2-5]
MRDRDIYAKTVAGRDEIATRARKLPSTLRALLLVVDGQRDAAELLRLGAGLHAPDDGLAQLRDKGLIALRDEVAAAGGSGDAAPADAAAIAPSERFRTMSALMSEAVKAHLGLRGFMMQLKIERCGNAEELAVLLPELRAALAKSRGDAVAGAWLAAVQASAGAEPVPG